MHWVFVAALGLSLVVASGDCSPEVGELLIAVDSLVALGRAGSEAVTHGLRCSAVCGILPDQRSNPCLLHWQVDSLPLEHQGSPISSILLLKTPGPLKVVCAQTSHSVRVRADLRAYRTRKMMSMSGSDWLWDASARLGAPRSPDVLSSARHGNPSTLDSAWHSVIHHS